jgi:hypothetical protein
MALKPSKRRFFMRLVWLSLIAALVLPSVSLAERTFENGGKIFYNWCISDDDHKYNNIMTILWENLLDEDSAINPNDLNEEACYQGAILLAAATELNIDTLGYHNLADTLEPLADLKNLKSLSMDAVHFNAASMAPISQLTGLESLVISFGWGIHSLDFLKTNTKLKTLTFYGPQKANDNKPKISLAPLIALTLLEDVEIDAFGVENDPAITQLKQFPNMNFLKINDSTLINKSQG